MLSSSHLCRERSVTSTEDECPYGRAIRVKDFWPTLLQRLLKSYLAETSIQGVGKLPSQHIATKPVQDGHQIHEAAGHSNVGYIATPDLVAADDSQIAQ
jgi:hypothetical protein